MRRKRTGFLVLDAIGGLLVVGVLASLLMVAMSRQNRAGQQLAESREVIRLAERTLMEMQAARGIPAAGADQGVRVRRLPGGQEVAGWVWVEVQTESSGHRAALTGLVPQASAPQGAGGVR